MTYALALATLKATRYPTALICLHVRHGGNGQ